MRSVRQENLVAYSGSQFFKRKLTSSSTRIRRMYRSITTRSLGFVSRTRMLQAPNVAWGEPSFFRQDNVHGFLFP